ncbi:protein kinase-like domain-containing protein [Artemisia annua]|uniref:Protein kinase-like domain-containing protein n=1 Tax=Artemisia annua TaxID=35608 RepID=A0A2U1ND56_ARTAN|nr:protein kinase-like domain-containing protein [Artemisia annua]
MPKVSNCSLTKSVDLGSSPFIFSKTHNRFVYEGYCGNAVMMDDEGSFVTGCSTTCSNDSTGVTLYRNNKCSGIKCCETTIPHYLKSYGLNLTGLERQLGGDGACGSAFLVDQSAYDEGRFSGNSIPTSLLWTLGDLDYDQISCCNQAGPRLEVVEKHDMQKPNTFI